jgi:hypothetical protein
MNSITYNDITLDWHPYGVTVSALVTDTYNSTPWLESLQIIPDSECDSQWHIEGECECTPDAHYLETYRQHLTANSYRLVTWEELED